MLLHDYLEREGRGAQARLAREIEAHESDVSDWKHGERQVPARFAVRIEKATDAAVTCEELRPDVAWFRTSVRKPWPHPAGFPVLEVE